MTLSADELRRKAEAARKVLQDRAALEEIEAQRKFAALLKKAKADARRELKNGTLPWLEKRIDEVATGGGLSFHHNFTRFASPGVGEGTRSSRALFESVEMYKLELIKSHFEAMGFKVDIRAPGGMKFGSDGAFSDGYRYPEITIHWDNEK